MTVTDVNVVKSAIFERPDDANKGTLGSLLCVCGSYGMAGAAVMSAKGALRTGIGLAKCVLPRSIYPIVAQTILESVYYPLSENADGRISKVNVPFLVSESCKSSATLVGCGLGVCDDTLKIVFSLIENSTTPLVLDADALNCVAKQPEILLRKKALIIITPHPGEMSRLTGLATPLVNAERERVALNFAQKYGVVTVLKGAGTVIASPNGKVLVNPTGNSGMATGGSGDVLAGMTASILAQGASAFSSAAAAVYLHGLAGDIAAEKYGKISMLPTDLINCIPLAYKRCGF